ncbi:DUF4202 domain-containing protein [Marinibactrum halimedae]|uniref:DUF4202 domain-containing protein n=1 Tax=Marinibactrum halimedae TaxID=1444977 RepID=A0AA37WLI3_9GAMM|nr:DUF4202 domain-containing protein [Marinibactrum halimedae]MCD9458650.1 DUF4202 domain-containing protein [Marinibactrum halimedae]GLS25984.1 hypothetical protein GCM10007877_16990 [Marinibactrum halimedae]
MSMSALESVKHRIDELNTQDPNSEYDGVTMVPKEWLYSQRMSTRLNLFQPDANELLQIAAHGQHIMRWKSPRSDYPMTKAGYKQWRLKLAQFHGEQVAKVMAAHQYPESDQTRVKDLLLKKRLKKDEDAQALEDVICLVFLEHYFEPFAQKHTDEKVIDILRKTWNKMSPTGHEHALTLAPTLSPPLQSLISRALS